MDDRRSLPAVGRLVAAAPDLPRPLVVQAARALIEAVRAGAPSPADWNASVRAEVTRRARPRLRQVLNATGIVLHTNLGRAPLGARARQRVMEIAEGAANVELDLQTGARGERLAAVESLLGALTGAEAAVAVNNNAAAVLLALSALAAGKDVLVSRGELVEIGGSFRVPEVIAAGGARLVEVGTTNRTRVADFAKAITPQTGAILRVHPSNFRVTGFVEAPEPAALLELARGAGVPLIDDLGAGAIAEGLGEPTVAEHVALADVVCFSGDKLLGGPQAGLIVGGARWVARTRKHPLYRALRLDRLVLAALEGTLQDYEAGDEPPAVAMLRTALPALKARAKSLAASLSAGGIPAEAVATTGFAGGGSLPGSALPGFGVSLGGQAVDHRLARLREGALPVVARAHDGVLLLDLRAIPPAHDERLLRAVLQALHGSS